VRRLLKPITVVLLCFSLGLHWFGLQTVAWTTMLIERTQAVSFTVALKTTFDGQHPCKICQTVREGQAAENKSESQLKLQKLELVAPSEAVALVVAPEPEPAVFTPSVGWPARADVPMLPPPRTA